MSSIRLCQERRKRRVKEFPSSILCCFDDEDSDFEIKFCSRAMNFFREDGILTRVSCVVMIPSKLTNMTESRLAHSGTMRNNWAIVAMDQPIFSIVTLKTDHSYTLAYIVRRTKENRFRVEHGTSRVSVSERFHRVKWNKFIRSTLFLSDAANGFFLPVLAFRPMTRSPLLEGKGIQHGNFEDRQNGLGET